MQLKERTTSSTNRVRKLHAWYLHIRAEPIEDVGLHCIVFKSYHVLHGVPANMSITPRWVPQHEAALTRTQTAPPWHQR